VAKSPTLYDSSVHMPNMVRSQITTWQQYNVAARDSSLVLDLSQSWWQLLRLLQKLLWKIIKMIRVDRRECGLAWQRVITFGWSGRRLYLDAVTVVMCCSYERRWGRGEGLGFEFFITPAMPMSEQGLSKYQDTHQWGVRQIQYLGVQNKCVACFGSAYKKQYPQ